MRRKDEDSVEGQVVAYGGWLLVVGGLRSCIIGGAVDDESG